MSKIFTADLPFTTAPKLDTQTSDNVDITGGRVANVSLVLSSLENPILNGDVTGDGVGTSPGNLLKITSTGNLTTPSNLPLINTDNRLTFQRKTTSQVDFADFFFVRNSDYAGGDLEAINRTVGVNFTVGQNTHNPEHGIIIHGFINSVTESGTLRPAHYGLWSQMDRNPGSNGHCTGIVSNVVDFTGLGTLAGNVPNLLGIECDVYANGPDDQTNLATFGGEGVRRILSCTAGQIDPSGARCTFSVGILVATYQDAEILQMIGVKRGSSILNGLDTRGAVVPDGTNDPLAAVRMTGGHIIDFNGGLEMRSPPGNYLTFVSSRLNYMAEGEVALSISENGSVGIGMLSVDAQKISITGSATIGINLSDAVLSGAAIRLADDQYIGFTPTDSIKLSHTVTGTPRIRYVASSEAELFSVTDSGDVTVSRGLGVFGTAAIIAKPNVTGSRGSNAALASLLTALESYGLITNSTS